MKATKTWVLIVLLLIPAINVHAWPIPDTGQTKCYNNTAEIPCPAPGAAFYGQDGNYTIDPPSYTKLDANGAVLSDAATSWGMVKDNVTGLIWENKTSDGFIHDGAKTFTWCDTDPATNGSDQGTCGTGTGNAATDTAAFIKALNDAKFGGFSDWRMPNVKELQSIVDLSKYSPTINTTWFPGTVSDYYWSPTTFLDSYSRAWCANFGDGGVLYTEKTFAWAVRAVRGGQSRSLGHLVINGDGTVTDTDTGLMWQQDTLPVTITWEAALTYAEGLTLAGYDDWRLPTSKELQSIIDYNHFYPAIDISLFPGTVSSGYWSSTTYDSCDNARSVYFFSGGVGRGVKSNAFADPVRAVRGGQSRVLGHLVISEPRRASRWNIGEQKTVTWDPVGIAGNVKISLSRQGGNPGTFSEVIVESTPNSGTFDWTVTGPESFYNCALRIEPISDLAKGATQSLFTIATLQRGWINAARQSDPSRYKITLNGQYADGILSLEATFTTSDATIATVDAYGFLTALKNGYAEISTTCESKTYKKGLFVYNTPDILEIESNNTKITANALSENQYRRGKLSAADDIDYHKLTLNSPSLVAVGFLSQSTTADVKMDIYNASDILLASGTSMNGQFLTFPLGLPAGEYYLKLTPSGDLDDVNYYIVAYKNLGALPVKAVVPIALGETKEGVVNTLTDSTDFSFSLSKEQAVKTTFTPSSDQAKYHIAIIDGSQTMVDQIDCLGQIPVTLEAVYGPGSYTLRVTPVNVVDASSPFTVQLSASADQMEKEPNNTSTQATNWIINQAISGRLFSTDDADFYQFTLDQAKILDLTFSCPGSSKNFTVALYKDSDQNEINGINVIGGKATTLPLSLEAGTYFLKIGGDGPNTDTLHAYTLTLADSSQTNLETEPNNAIASANPLENDIARKGRIFNALDKDIYGFFLPETASFTVSFTPTTTTGDYKVSVLDVLGNVLDSFTSADGQVKTPEVYQAPGNFYVRIEANGHIDQVNPYEIKVSSTAIITAPRSYAITAGAGAGGSITPSGSVNLLHSTGQTFTITPDAHYHVVDVTVDGVSVGAVTSYNFTNVTAAHTISATFAIDAYVITSSAGANGSITPSATVNHGSSSTFTITPAANYHVADVLVDGKSVGTLTSYTFTDVTAVHTISVTFAINTYAITSSVGGANGSITASATVNHGSNSTFTITPNANYHVSDVLVDGTSVGPVTTYSFNNVTAVHAISVTFAINTYAITSSAGANGAITASATVNHGSNSTFTITPNANYHVVDVLVDGNSVGTLASYTFTDVTAAHTISVTFAINTYAITSSAGANGAITASTTVNHGSNSTFTITPNANYHVFDVLVDGNSVGTLTSYTFTDVSAVHTISATFAINTYAITSSAGANGAITASATVNHGSSQTFTITPNANYHVADVLVDGISVGPVAGYNFTNVTATHTISATFAINTYAITSSAGANGTISASATVNHGNSSSFTITPVANYHVADVLVDGTSVGPVTSYRFSNVTAVHTIRAAFAIDTYTLTVTKSGTGLGIVTVSPGNLTWEDATGNAAYDYGTQISLTAVAGADSTFTGWAGVGCLETVVCMLTIDKTTSVVAVFTLKGDINQDGLVDLSDAILAIRIVSKNYIPDTFTIDAAADVNDDHKIGMEDVIISCKRSQEFVNRNPSFIMIV